MSKPITIYGLIDPRNNELYYVGQTRRDLVERTDEHFFESKDTPVSKRNQAILQLGKAPAILKLAEVTSEEAAFHAELYWIHSWAMQGKRLLNREAQPWFVENYTALLDPVRLKEGRSALGKDASAKKRAPVPALRTETYAKAKKIAPERDIHALEKEWRAWMASKNRAPDYPDSAFLAFCKKKTGRREE